MTEICEISNQHSAALLWPRYRPAQYLIDPVAFFVALIGAPLLVALLGFWALGIPVFAVVFGGLPYLIIGGPILASQLRHNQPYPSGFAMLGLIANILMLVPSAIVLSFTGNQEIIGFVAFLFGFGLVFAPMWCAVFAILYRRLRREFYQNPIS